MRRDETELAGPLALGATEVGVPRGVDHGVRAQEGESSHSSVARGRKRLLVRGHELELEAPRLVLHELVLEHLLVVREDGRTASGWTRSPFPGDSMSSTRPGTAESIRCVRPHGHGSLEKAAMSPSR